MRKVLKREERFLHELWELRYLSSVQIQQLWYRGRSIENCRVRLSRLAKDGYLVRQPLYDDVYRFAWCLGLRGYASLRKRFGGEYKPYDALSAMFIPHLIETNGVYLTLRDADQSLWEELPFVWRGSHRTVLRYCARDNAFSKLREREIRPDAIVEPKGSNVCVFLELDRCTESLVSGTGRRSIESKLEAYAEYLDGRTMQGTSWFEKQYGKDKKVRIVFVVPGRGKSTERIDHIRSMMQQHPVAKFASVYSLSSAEHGAIRRACGLPEEAPTTVLQTSSPLHDVTLWRKLYEVSAQAYRRMSPEASLRPKLLNIVQQAEARLMVLDPTMQGGVSP